MCTVFQLYAMTFTGIMSIVPIEMNQPAVYFMPLTMAFVAAFVFSFYHSVTLVFVELGAYTIASYLTKSSEIFVIDLFSCILGVFLSVLVAKILFSHRARENESRQQLRRTGMIDQLTSTYNKATTEFLCREYLREHPSASRREIVENSGVTISEDGVKYNLARLQDLHRIKRVGPDYGGHWEVCD